MKLQNFYSLLLGEGFEQLGICSESDTGIILTIHELHNAHLAPLKIFCDPIKKLLTLSCQIWLCMLMFGAKSTSSNVDKKNIVPIENNLHCSII